MTLAFLSGIGSGELILIVAVALIVLGPKRFPEIARKIGGVVRDLRRATNDLQRQIDDEIRAVDVEVRDVVPRKGAWQAPALLPPAAADAARSAAQGLPVEISAPPPNRATYGMAAAEVDGPPPAPAQPRAPAGGTPGGPAPVSAPDADTPDADTPDAAPRRDTLAGDVAPDDQGEPT